MPPSLNTALSLFPGAIQAELRAIFSQKAFIPSWQVATLLDRLEIDIGQLMIRFLPVAAAYARPLISDFSVGAVALGMAPDTPDGGPGSLYLGANLEYRHEALSFVSHAEQGAVNNAWLHGETGLQALAINAAPCGYCRQFLYELNTATTDFNILLKANKNKDDDSYTSKPLTWFLPDAFGPADLGFTAGLMDPENHELTASVTDPAVKSALEAANACYCPYTQDFSGVALVDIEGRIFSGRYAENAAYNPSLSPMESALASMSMSLPPQSPLDISRAVLVEAPAHISQEAATKAVLSSIAPNISLEYVAAILPS